MSDQVYGSGKSTVASVKKFWQILIEPCHRENIENTYLVSIVTLCFHTILFVYIIVNVCKQSLISWGWSVAR